MLALSHREHHAGTEVAGSRLSWFGDREGIDSAAVCPVIEKCARLGRDIVADCGQPFEKGRRPSSFHSPRLRCK
jgi:hypothetical protein